MGGVFILHHRLQQIHSAGSKGIYSLNNFFGAFFYFVIFCLYIPTKITQREIIDLENIAILMKNSSTKQKIKISLKIKSCLFVYWVCNVKGQGKGRDCCHSMVLYLRSYKLFSRKYNIITVNNSWGLFIHIFNALYRIIVP